MSTLEQAIALAAHYHAGQQDKGGQPYILHPLAVMARVEGEFSARVLGTFAELDDAYPQVAKQAGNFLAKQHKANILNVEEANFLFPHLKNLLLHKRGVIDYNIHQYPPILEAVLQKINL